MAADHKNANFGNPAIDDQLCPFCNLEPSRIFADNEHAVAIYDGFPVNPGHVLIIPKRHVVSLFEVTKEERAALFDLLDDVRCRLIAERKPDGFNIGINDGAAAGQTVFHLHIHLIPRYVGDCEDPRGGVRKLFPGRARYWKKLNDEG
ncbi:MAG: HIT family protein [Geobacteraceae bacterium]|nr:HIT family protein [Geobacteraceae bacterium]